jgi:hypothetical protein
MTLYVAGLTAVAIGYGIGYSVRMVWLARYAAT